ncbi:helix-turn-helix domain-containing protein [Bdellovibrionales bacterium]|nr:helix-turn-helix domain-containing protein [Bdellovibrionales bacterium]
MIEVGQILKQEREKQGHSIRSIAQTTKINASVIVAIEEGDRELLPQEIFLKGFLRTYAHFLHLNPTDIIELYNQTTEKNSEEVLQPVNPPRRSFLGDRYSFASKGIAVLVIVLLISAIIVINTLIQKYEKEGEIALLPKNIKTIDATLPATKEASAIVGGKRNFEKKTGAAEARLKAKREAKTKAEQVAKLEIEKKAAVEAKRAAKLKTEKEERAEAEQVAKLEIEKKAAVEAKRAAELKAEKEERAEAERSAKLKSSEETELPSPKAPTVAKNRALLRQELIIEALDQVTVNFQIDQQGQKEIILQPDQIHTMKAAKTISLQLSDGGAVNVIFNGKDKGVPGELGHPKKIRFP